MILAPTFNLSAQVKVDWKTQTAVDFTLDFVKDQENFVKKFPNVNPFLTLATTLIFKVDEGPSYSEMKAEWEGYTDKKIDGAIQKLNSARLQGYLDRIKDIDDSIKEDQIAGKSGTKLSFENKVKEWESLESDIFGDLRHFESKTGEPAAPLLPMFGATTNLNIVALDRLIILNANLSEFQPRSEQTEFRRKSLQKRETRMEELNKRLEKQIQKAAQERKDQVVVEVTKSQMGNLPGEIERDESGKITNVIEKPAYIWTHCIKDAGKSMGCRTDPSPSISEPATAKRNAENYKTNRQKSVYDQTIFENKRLFEIRKTTVLKVTYIHPDVTLEKFHKMFSVWARPGSFVKSGIMYSKLPNQIQIGWCEGIHNRLSPKFSCNEWLSIANKADGWQFSGNGYVEMETAYAMDVKQRWMSDDGQRRARGEGGSKEKLTSSNILIEEDTLMDPWTLKHKNYSY
jgi:hypothetical protein